MKINIQKGLLILAILLLSFSTLLSAQERRPGRLFPPEKIQILEKTREWQDAKEVMDRLSIRKGDIVADIGAGAGYFTLPLAQRVGAEGLVYAEDIQQAMVDYLSKKVETLELRNIKVMLGKADNPNLPENSLNLALLANTYHEVEKPMLLWKAIGKELKADGRLAIIDWDPAKESPIGPPKQDKVPEDTVIKEVEEAGFLLSGKYAFMPYHYFLVFKKK
ncbi:MAG TPA: class I SAM-dependent methyltransferase [Candidatus Hypogeohydataceae bacterium YC41]